MPRLILINGLPGTGKTTLAAKLSPDLGIPCMGKDMLKEFFFDALGGSGRENSRMLGRAVSEMLYILAEEYVKSNQDFILENAFFVEFARPKMEYLQATYPKLEIIEVYCATDKNTRRQRFQDRNESGERHQGHIDGTDLTLLGSDDPEPLDVYAPIDVGEVITVDTTSFGDAEYAALLQNIQETGGRT